MATRTTIGAIPATLWVVCGLLVAGVTMVRAQDHLSALKSAYRRPPPQPVANPALVQLGRELFFSSQISASGRTACASCHFPELGWGVNDPTIPNDSGRRTSRTSQPLTGIGHASGPYGWDGRNPTLEAQVKSSIATGSMSMNATPTPVKVEVIEGRIRSDAAYVAKFRAALGDAPITIDTIAQAIAAFERTLEPGVAPFDRWIEGDGSAISQAAKRGFELYNGNALCFTCHRGWRFTDDLFHDIGTTTTDRGRGAVVKDDPLMQFAFKTPTLRDVALRPPYMHSGQLATLDEVMRHYEKGGIIRPSRSPLMLPIRLADQERQDIVAFMETLNGSERASKIAPRR
ncbi:MAG: tryptophan tryptophylquinone biosynthesis enzyme MauG [Xanthobacteraceae bacterium]|nr:tryptophan tryptophylquinone biosynthesis enzyme MauG [Xanthobacteraceae bacterium]